jgi:hypothetical protein
LRALTGAGWDLNTQLLEEVALTSGRDRGSEGQQHAASRAARWFCVTVRSWRRLWRLLRSFAADAAVPCLAGLLNDQQKECDISYGGNANPLAADTWLAQPNVLTSLAPREILLTHSGNQK